MALKYYIEYTNISGDEIRIDIEQEGFSGDSIRVQGNATLHQASVNSILSPLRGMGLSLELEASKDLDFTDLYSEKETDFKVYLYRNSILVFAGFIKPDGLWQDFVNDNWIISLKCIDGLGILKNLRFVDSNGSRFQGLMTEEDIIYNCLARTSLELPMNVRIQLEALGEDSSNKSIVSKVRLNTERFYKESEDSDKEIMDCEEILKSILEKYNAVIQQRNGEWYIFRPIDLIGSNVNSFFRYVKGESVSLENITTHKILGSNIDGFFPHHASSNQRIALKSAVSAFRVKFDYGLVRSLINNNRFLDNGDGWEWSEASTYGMQFLPAGGVQFNPNSQDYYEGTWNNLTLPVFTLNQIIITEVGDELSVNLNAITAGALSQFPVEIINRTPEGDYYYINGVWSLTPRKTNLGDFTLYTIECFGNGPDQLPTATEGATYGTGVEYNYTLELSPIQQSGELIFKIYRPHLHVPGDTKECYPMEQPTYAMIYSVDIKPRGGNLDVDGEIHTAYRTPATSSDIEDSKEVFNGDMNTDIYVGAMKLSSGENTTLWNEIGVSEEKELLQIMVEDRIKLQAKSQKVFSGDVFGYMDSLSIIEINNLEGKFLPISFNWDTKQDLCNFTMHQYYKENLSESDMLYEKTYDRGKVIKPTIVG